MARTSANASLPRSVLSALWTVLLVSLAIGATANLFSLGGDFVQPYCTNEPGDSAEPCRPCGLRWGMFGVLEATQCPRFVIDELLTVFVVAPRLLVVLFGLAWFLTGPLLVANFAILAGRWRRGDRTLLNAIQLGVLTYVLLWSVVTGALFLIPALGAAIS